MSINLSIKNVPESLADALRARAESHHRSLQGELMSILEAAVGPGMTAQQTLALAGEVEQVLRGPDEPEDFSQPLQLLAQRISFVDPVTGQDTAFESQLKLRLV